jgi:acylphosphatase
MVSMAVTRVLVGGRVQGVGFRWAVMAEALRLGVAGWVRNLDDGRVEVHAQGEAGAVAALSGWLRSGPPGARVTEFAERQVASEEGLEGFVIRG